MQGTVHVQNDRAPVLVLGAGITGVAAVRHLLGRGVRCRVADDRSAPPGLAELRALLPPEDIVLGGFDEAVLHEVGEVVVSPGLSPNLPLLGAARGRGLVVRGELDLFLEECRAPVIAITGTNGKSTVTRLTAALLQGAGVEAAAGGNLGPPAVSLLEGPAPDACVLEVSSFQLEYTPELPARAAAVLNVAPDHFDRHEDLDVYAAVKSRIYAHAQTAVVNRDDARVRAMVAHERSSIGFTAGMPAAGDYGLLERGGELLLARGSEALIAASRLRVTGRHNLCNALAALALVEAFGMDPRRTLDALAAFEALPHRCQPVATTGGRRWIDDSKGTNLAATLAAVEGMAGPLVLIAGGIAKERDFAPLAEALAGKARAIVLLGRDAPLLAEALAGVAPVLHAGDMKQAVALAHAHSQEGDIVLLSPACASLDQFTDYRQRGQAFAAAARGRQP